MSDIALQNFIIIYFPSLYYILSVCLIISFNENMELFHKAVEEIGI